MAKKRFSVIDKDGNELELFDSVRLVTPKTITIEGKSMDISIQRDLQIHELLDHGMVKVHIFGINGTHPFSGNELRKLSS